jgi:methyl-accepting chemotaxis protein
MNELGSSSVELGGLVSSLEKANRAIVEGIENISAATEEVTAHSNQTFENNEENLAIAQDINRVIDDLGNMANKLASVTR